MKNVTKKDILLKDGSTLPKGLPVTFITDSDRCCLVHSPTRETPFKVRIVNAFKAPSMTSLERWNYDGVCKTPTGKRVEPDGYGPDGSPSWLLVFGVI